MSIPRNLGNFADNVNANGKVEVTGINATGTASSTTALFGDGTWQSVSVTPAGVSDQNNTSTGYFDLPSGTTAQRPASPTVGMTRFNTTTDSLETYSSGGWQSVTVGLPTLNSYSGYIVYSYSTTLTILGSNFGSSSGTVRFVSGSTTATVTVTPLSQTSLTVVVPATIYGLAAGSTVTIAYINAYGQLSTNTLNVDVAGLPTGGTITTYSNYRVHTFTSSGNFVSGVGFTLPTDWLVVAGGGAGGWDVGGGGGAGGYIYQASQSTAANTTYSIVVGSGGAPTGAGGSAGNGTNSTAKGFTAIGGGGAGNYDGGNGASGGCGGGASGYGRTTYGGSGTSGQGYAGGDGVASYANNGTGGGGGGAGSAGSPSANNNAGFANGGNGVANSITGTSVTYAAGGKGGGDNWSGTQSGAANTGNGGDGAGNPNTGGTGGSGVVIVRYQIA